MNELYHDFGKGDNKYPGDITGVTELLNGGRGGSKTKDREDDRCDGLVTSFVQRDLSGVRCYRCQKMGHYARDCPLKDGTDGGGRLINIEATSAFQLSDVLDDHSEDSYNSAQERADEWNSYYF